MNQKSKFHHKADFAQHREKIISFVMKSDLSEPCVSVVK
jgi:hypothetical protein